MLPAVAPGDQLLCSREVTIFKGALVVRSSEVDGRIVYLVKRVTAVAGDLRQGHVIPRGHCWIEGDNQAASADSRHFGPIPLTDLVGVAVARLTVTNQLVDATLNQPD